jgi:hypothetical protein
MSGAGAALRMTCWFKTYLTSIVMLLKSKEPALSPATAGKGHAGARFLRGLYSSSYDNYIFLPSPTGRGAGGEGANRARRA